MHATHNPYNHIKGSCIGLEVAVTPHLQVEVLLRAFSSKVQVIANNVLEEALITLERQTILHDLGEHGAVEWVNSLEVTDCDHCLVFHFKRIPHKLDIHGL